MPPLPTCSDGIFKSRAGSPDERRCFQRLREYQTLPAKFRIRGEPAQARQRLLELSPAAVRVENQPLVCSCLRRYAIDEYVATCCRVPIQDFIIGALQNDRGQRRIEGVTIEQAARQAKAARWIGYMCCITGKDDTADTIAVSRALVHAIRGCSFELVRALARQYLLVYTCGSRSRNVSSGSVASSI